MSILQRRLVRVAATAVAVVAFVIGIPTSAEANPLDPTAFGSLGTLNVNAGTLTFNTDTLTVTGGGAGLSSTIGVVHVQGLEPGTGRPLPDVAVFTFNNIVIDGTTNVVVQGSRPLALLSKGDATIAVISDIDNRGSNGVDAFAAISAGAGGAGGPAGGGAGGTGGAVASPGTDGAGTGGGAGGHIGFTSNNNADGGGFGGSGGDSFFPGFPNITYGDLSVALEAGSGGGGGGDIGAGGGGGGGGLEIGAVGALTFGGIIIARGGAAGGKLATTGNGGGGSGGGVLVHGNTVTGAGISTILAEGGLGGGDIFDVGGGGGRVLVLSDSYTLGTSMISANVLARRSLTSSAGDGSDGVKTLNISTTIIPGGAFSQLDANGSSLVAVGSGWPDYQSTTLQVNTGGLAFAPGAVTSPHDLLMQGGNVAAGLGWTMDGTAQLSGFGTVAGPFSGGAANHIMADGSTLTLGDINSAAGFDFAGMAEVAAGSTLQVQDQDKAMLGASTMIGAGGRLAALNGTELGIGETLTGAAGAEVAGAFTNLGVVNGPGGMGDFLTFTDSVNGDGSYTGNIMFSDGFSPGLSPGLVSMENVVFDATNTLFIELGGLLRGGEYDAIDAMTATLGGTLSVSLFDLGLGDGIFSPAVGDSFDILIAEGGIFGDFGAFDLPVLAGGAFLEPSIISLPNPGDVYRLTVVDNVSPVPLPAALPLFLSGLASLGWLGWRRRKRETGA